MWYKDKLFINIPQWNFLVDPQNGHCLINYCMIDDDWYAAKYIAIILFLCLSFIKSLLRSQS